MRRSPFVITDNIYSGKAFLGADSHPLVRTPYLTVEDALLPNVWVTNNYARRMC